MQGRPTARHSNNPATAWYHHWFGGGGDEESLDPPPAPPNRADLSTANPYATLPDGWSTAVNPVDGRVYYWEKLTGRTSWTHPHAPTTNTMGNSGGGPRIVPPPQTRNNSNNNNNPLLPPPPPAAPPYYYDTNNENPLHANRRPDSNECHSFVALCCCPLIGSLAVYHSCLVNSRWNEGRYGDAVHHARQAPKYATLAIVVGLVFWIYWFFFREGARERWEWPAEWDFNWGD